MNPLVVVTSVYMNMYYILKSIEYIYVVKYLHTKSVEEVNCT